MNGPDILRAITRRHFFKQSGFGIGGVALSALLDERLFAQQRSRRTDPLAPRAPHFAPKAKHIIYLFMAGAPTQLDLFDNKPALQKYDGQEIPAEFIPKGERFAFIKGTPRLLGFAVHVQEVRPVRAPSCPSCCRTWRASPTRSPSSARVHTTQFNHAPGQIFMNTGSQVFGRPSIGSWLTYGLGQREPRSARLRRAALGRERARRRQVVLGQRISADGLPGRRVPLEGRSGPVRVEPGGRRHRRAARARSIS